MCIFLSWCIFRHMNGQTCQYSNVPDMYNLCRLAHSQDELDEWRERYEWRLMKREMARQGCVFSYMDLLLEKYESSNESVKIVSRHMAWISVSVGICFCHWILWSGGILFKVCQSVCMCLGTSALSLTFGLYRVQGSTLVCTFSGSRTFRRWRHHCWPVSCLDLHCDPGWP